MDLEERVGACQAQKQGEGGYFWQTLGRTGVGGAQGLSRDRHKARWSQEGRPVPVTASPLNTHGWACSQQLLLLAGCLGLNSASFDGMR